MSGQQHVPVALYPRERPGTHFTGGWVGPRAGLDGWKISSPTGLDPAPSNFPAVHTKYNDHIGRTWRSFLSKICCYIALVLFLATQICGNGCTWEKSETFTRISTITNNIPKKRKNTTLRKLPRQNYCFIYLEILRTYDKDVRQYSCRNVAPLLNVVMEMFYVGDTLHIHIFLCGI